VYVNGSANVVVDGFEMTNLDPSYTCGAREPYFIVHIQDASDVTLQNNIIHGNAAAGRCNELVKVNRGDDTAYPKNIVIRGNVIYDHVNSGGADMIDSVRPGEIEIVDNIFWGDPAKTSAQSFITLKRQAPAVGTPKSPRYWIHRNVFLRWGGKSDQAFVQLGEDGVDFAEISDALIENNLMIGNSPSSMAAPFQFKGAENVTVRANTVLGDLPGGAYGLRIGTEGSNPPVTGYFVRGNIFADPTGTMGNRLVNLYGQASGVELDHNLFFNAGAPLPSQGGALPSDDANALTADPLVPTDQTSIVLPEWQSGGFPSGSSTIRDEFLRLVESYGALSTGSPAIDSGDPSNMPADDIRALARDATPDRGAYEFAAATPAPDAGVGGSGSGGAPGSGGSATGGAPGSGGASGTAATDSGDDGGCGCRTARGHRSTGFGMLLALGLLLGARRRYPER
jgi:MYXO-CTERM domain-containing protein